ncbi:MAG: hypothetical protein ATN36_07870 [Epulopiscium sp. Nele67-Bin005]|nr:MAG: hypothetical protein ATN36_07870 [Epulopiscium sp. Nele67-Bin005]
MYNKASLLNYAKENLCFGQNLKSVVELHLLEQFIKESSQDEINELLKQLNEFHKEASPTIEQLNLNIDEEYNKVVIENLNLKLQNAYNYILHLEDVVEKLQSQTVEELRFLKNEAHLLQNKKEIYKKNLKKVEQNLNEFRLSYETLEDIYNLYLSIPNEIQLELSHIFKSTNNSCQFLACSSNIESLKLFWDYIFECMQQEKDENNLICNLITIFDYFFDLYNQLNPNIERCIVEVGDKYDKNLHTSLRRVIGNIKLIQLLGIQDNTTNEIIRKSIVWL